MKKLVIILYTISNLSFSSSKINFRHISVDKDGLSESTIHQIFQDSQGFIWITTDNGLDKYDGYSIKQYQHLTEDEKSISQGAGSAIYEDRDGNIWISTNSGDINKLNPEKETFERIPVYTLENVQTGGNVSVIQEDGDGKIWVLDNKLVQINPTNDDRKYFFAKDSSYSKSFFKMVDSLEKSNLFLAGIKTPGNSVDSTQSLTITEKKKLLVVCMGEMDYSLDGGMGNPYDIGWITNEKGETIWSIWKKGDKSSAHGGGAISQRVKAQQIELSPGNYKIHYRSDAIHSYKKWSLFPPENQNLWGINIYDISNLEKSFSLSKELNGSDLRSFPSDFVLNNDETIWISTYHSGLVLFHPDSGVVQRYAAKNSGTKENPKISCFFSLTKDPYNDDYLWLSSPRGVHRFNSMTGKFKHYYIDPNGSKEPGKNQAGKLAFLNKEHLWMVYGEGGVVILNINNGTIKHIKNDPENQKSLTSNAITFLMKDNSGAMWVGTGSKGIGVYDPYFEKFGHIRYSPNTKNAFSRPNVMGFHEDINGFIWIASEGGLYRFNPKTSSLKNMNAVLGWDRDVDSATNGILIDNNMLFIGTENPLDGAVVVKHDIKTGKTTTYKHSPEKSYTLPKAPFITDLYKDSRGVIWIAAGGNQVIGMVPDAGIFIYPGTDIDKTNYKDKKYLSKIKTITEKIYGYGIRTIKEDDSGNILFAGAGMFKINFNSGESKYFSHNPLDPESIPSGMIINLLVDSRGSLWAGTWGGGMCRLNNKTEKFKRYYKKEGGLPNNVVTGIIEDNEGYFWISTKGGMCRFNPIKETFESYYAQDGLQSNEFLTDAAFIASDGTVYFGGGNGATYFKPEKINKNPNPPSIAITSVKKDGVPEILGLRSSQVKNMIITYKDRGVSFDFTGLNFTRTEKNRYAYQMEGYDPEWVLANDRRFASYTNLPPGDYVFKVKGSNNDGVWNEKGASVAILVHPPPWATWWAYVIYISILGLSIYGFIIYREREQKRELEENRKTEELEMARQFQLDMLPKSMPKTPHYDIAAVIETSTEVGGDYYDFFPQDDGSLYVITGDATGHGMTAGMMVSITKAGLYGIPAIPTDKITNRLNRVIKNIELGTNRMALNVSYFTEGSLQFTSAGMPPAYHCSSDTGKVKEILQVGLPLGGIRGEKYIQEQYSFDGEDTIVFLSDGLPEAENPSGVMLGYDAVFDCIGDNKNKDVETIKSSLLRLGKDWLNGAPLQDDITIVVVKKKK